MPPPPPPAPSPARAPAAYLTWDLVRTALHTELINGARTLDFSAAAGFQISRLDGLGLFSKLAARDCVRGLTATASEHCKGLPRARLRGARHHGCGEQFGLAC